MTKFDTLDVMGSIRKIFEKKKVVLPLSDQEKYDAEHKTYNILAQFPVSLPNGISGIAGLRSGSLTIGSGGFQASTGGWQPGPALGLPGIVGSVPGITGYNQQPISLRIPDPNYKPPSPYSAKTLPQIREFIYKFGEEVLMEKVKKYCIDTILLYPHKGGEEIVVAKSGDKLMPLIVYYDDTTESFRWDIEDDIKIARKIWKAIPNVQIFKILLKHKFLDMGLTSDTHALVTLDNPVLRPFPVNSEQSFYSWYIGFVIDVSHNNNR